MKKTELNILLLNLQYCMGMDGSIRQYILFFYRFIYLPKKIENKVIKNLLEIIKSENPDIICLIEVKKTKQIKQIINDEYPHFEAETKYNTKSILRKIPFTKNNSNAIISKEKLNIEKKYLEKGTKKLIYDVKLPNNSNLFLFHFSLSRKIRNKQFEEIKNICCFNTPNILCGDFNIFKGFNELKPLTESSNFQLINKKPTFPAHKPKKCLDTFLTTGDLNTTSKILPNKLSDHLPVILKIKH